MRTGWWPFSPTQDPDALRPPQNPSPDHASKRTSPPRNDHDGPPLVTWDWPAFERIAVALKSAATCGNTSGKTSPPPTTPSSPPDRVVIPQLKLLPDGRYYEELHARLTAACRRVYVSMFLFSPRWYDKTINLLADFTAASQRGLQCRIVMSAAPIKIGKRRPNQETAQRLLNAGWQVRVMTGNRTLHEKLLAGSGVRRLGVATAFKPRMARKPVFLPPDIENSWPPPRPPIGPVRPESG